MYFFLREGWATHEQIIAWISEVGKIWPHVAPCQRFQVTDNTITSIITTDSIRLVHLTIRPDPACITITITITTTWVTCCCKTSACVHRHLSLCHYRRPSTCKTEVTEHHRLRRHPCPIITTTLHHLVSQLTNSFQSIIIIKTHTYICNNILLLYRYIIRVLYSILLHLEIQNYSVIYSKLNEYY